MIIIEYLLSSDEPAIRLGMLQKILEKDLSSEEVKSALEALVNSSRVKILLSEREADGRIPWHPYTKWLGAHWVLSLLADLGYPSGDQSLLPLILQVCDWLLSEDHKKHIRLIDGRVRRCASQEGNALYSMLTLGLDQNGWADELASRLMRWQWPDGGWNCDKNPTASHSSFMESLIPLRALSLYARIKDDDAARQAATQAADIFLKHHLFKRLSDGSVIHPEFIQLHYPCYWHYDILFALKVMGEAGFLQEERCREALDLLETRRLPDGGWPADFAFYHVTDRPVSGRSKLAWGPVRKHLMNEFISVDALAVLRKAGRIVL